MKHYRTAIATSLSEVGEAAWENLRLQQEGHTPFLSYAFLHALHESGSACGETGWNMNYLLVWEETDAQPGQEVETSLAAALPLYLKTHSYGEYVFDWAWADAYQRHGKEYYPKLLSAIPFTPVAGPRLLARDEQARTVLLQALLALQQDVQKEMDVSSTHILFPRREEAALLAEQGFLLRHGVQFHWQNRGYADFAQFLASLEQKKRKNILAERRKVKEAGVSLRRVPGQEASEAEWAFFNRCYRQTYREHHSSPYLNLDFFQRIAREMGQHLLLVIASRDGQDIASALLVHDAERIYGRYWGAVEHVPCLHFEAAYYQGLEFCIEQGLHYFEGGAQGEHKMARGFLPHPTCSAHHLAHPAFAEAVQRFLQREGDGVALYMDELREREVFKERALPAGCQG